MTENKSEHHHFSLYNLLDTYFDKQQPQNLLTVLAVIAYRLHREYHLR